MSSRQRRRGQTVKVWPTHEIEDKRGNKVNAPDLTDDPIVVKAAAIPQRSSKAEVPGQQQIDVVRLILDAELPGVTLWSRVEYLGDQWDIVSPPAYHHGSRHVRHWSMDIRRRPV